MTQFVGHLAVSIGICIVCGSALLARSGSNPQRSQWPFLIAYALGAVLILVGAIAEGEYVLDAQILGITAVVGAGLSILARRSRSS
jgi:hypothetical protein